MATDTKLMQNAAKRRQIRRPLLGVCGVKSCCTAVSAVLNMLNILYLVYCNCCLGAKDPGRAIRRRRLSSPEPTVRGFSAFGVGHSTTFYNCCSHASQTLKMPLEFSESAQLASRQGNMDVPGPSAAAPDRGK